MPRLTARTASGIRVGARVSAASSSWYDWASIGKDNMDIVRLSVPGTLPYRDVVLRVVASVCRLVRFGMQQEPRQGALASEFDDKVVSAVGEAFNNIALHAYGPSASGEACLEFAYERDLLTIRMLDTGDGFDFAAAPGRNLEPIRESQMGLEIMRACMDEVSYSPGGPASPNVLTMTKRYPHDDRASGVAKSSD
jgi:serine/threonine-protein kinase RsbW